jgi:hypothetical protein
LKDKEIAIKRIKTSFEKQKLWGQTKILNWRAKFKKKKITNESRTKNTNFQRAQLWWMRFLKNDWS